MPKQKTHSGAKKRLQVTKTGKLQRRHSSGNHFLQKKSAARKRRFAGLQTVTGNAARNLKRKLGV